MICFLLPASHIAAATAELAAAAAGNIRLPNFVPAVVVEAAAATLAAAALARAASDCFAALALSIAVATVAVEALKLELFSAGRKMMQTLQQRGAFRH